MSDTDARAISVLIVGAGPVGMTLALTLRRAGISVVIVDKSPTTRRHSQAAVLWPRTLEILDLLGIVEDWDGHTVSIRAFAMNIDGQPGTLNLSPISGPHPFPVGVGQDVTEALLDACLRASGADYRRGVEVTKVQMDGEGGEATLRDQNGTVTTVRAEWIIGCEGSHSLVRGAAGIRQEGGKNAGVQLLQGDVRIRGTLPVAPGQGYLWANAGQQAMFILPTHPDGHCRALVTLPDDGEAGDPTLEQLETLAQKMISGISFFDPVWLNRYRTQHQLASEYRRGRAFVVGDAAHVWVPIGGQGMNIGMQDAFDLGWKLAAVIADGLPDAVLDTYNSERRPIGESNITTTEQLYQAMLSPDNLIDKTLRKIIPHALDFVVVDEAMSKRFSQTDFHYDASGIVSDKGHGGGRPAGTRAPDAYVTRDGQTTRLFNLYRTGKWTILGWAIDNGDTTAQAAISGLNFGNAFLVDATRKGVDGGQVPILRDIAQLAVEAYHVHAPEIHVIRPDGVIGYRGPADRAKLEAFLKPLGKA